VCWGAKSVPHNRCSVHCNRENASWGGKLKCKVWWAREGTHPAEDERGVSVADRHGLRDVVIAATAVLRNETRANGQVSRRGRETSNQP